MGDISPRGDTELYVLGSLLVWNWRLEDLPPTIYKTLRKTMSKILVHFKEWRVSLPMEMMGASKPTQVTPACYHFSFL